MLGVMFCAMVVRGDGTADGDAQSLNGTEPSVALDELEPAGSGDWNVGHLLSWNYTVWPEGDMLSDAIGPARLQPYYMIPMCNCMKAVVQFLVLGFDFKTKYTADKESAFTKFRKNAMAIPFIGLTLNCYHKDYVGVM